MKENGEAAQILGLDPDDHAWALQLPNGCRTRAVIATRSGHDHRFREHHSQVVVKLYKGGGNSKGSREYQTYHQTLFDQVPGLTDNRFVQQSVEGGVWAGVGPYAVVRFIEGEALAEVLDREELPRETAGTILHDILFNIWIPVWAAALRFKDCHPGNFVLSNSTRMFIIDTEQMRKDARELLTNGAVWNQRDKHEESGLKRLPGLIQRIVSAVHPGLAKAQLLREIREILAEVDLSARFRQLGQIPGAREQAITSAEHLLEGLRDRGRIA